MKTKSNRRVNTILILCLVLAGCREPSTKPSELGEQMKREMTLATPTVGGPSREFSVEKKPADIATAAQTVLEEAGVRIVREGTSDAGRWLLGKSLADRSVLVQILPIYPGRSTVKVTVEGADALTRELLNRLSADLEHRVR